MSVSLEYRHSPIISTYGSSYRGLLLLSVCIDERVERLQQYLEERRLPIPRLSFVARPCPLKIEPCSPYVDHVKWVSGLTDADVALGVSWLHSIVENVCADATD
jgi:hypothetical protein